MNILLLGTFLLHLAVGLLLSVLTVPWWVLAGAIALSSTTVDLSHNDASKETTGGSWAVVFFLAVILVMILGFGMVVLNLLTLVWFTKLSSELLPLGAALLTLIYLMVMLAIGDWVVRRRVKKAEDWFWLPCVGIAIIWALSLASWKITPQVTTAESGLRGATLFLESVHLQSWIAFLYQNARLYHVADVIVAFAIAWVASVFSTVPHAKHALHERFNVRLTILILLAILYAGLGAGWFLGKAIAPGG